MMTDGEVVALTGEVTVREMTPVPVRPNLLFIMTDQQRFDALSCHGGWIQTPHLDRLAAGGTDLQGHFSQSPVCVPSRCALFTGRYPSTLGVLENDRRLESDQTHLFEILAAQDYHLSYSGKNHFITSERLHALFDVHDDCPFGETNAELRRSYVALEDAAIERLNRIGSYASSEYHDFPDEVTTTGIIAQSTRNNLRQAPTDRPWCAVASFSDPHVPHLAPRRFEQQYPTEAMVVPPFDPMELKTKHLRAKVKRGAQGSDRATLAEQQLYLSVYGAMCSYVDEQIGTLLDALQQRDDAARTLVVFVSDHGDFCWHHGLCKKDLLLWDDLLHVPAILNWPGMVTPQKIDQTLTQHVDLVPTLLDLLGVEIPSDVQGESFANLCLGRTAMHRESVYAEVCYEGMRSGFDSAESFLASWREAQGTDSILARAAIYNVPGDETKSVRTAEWKYIWFGDQFEELYDLKRDPGERENLSADVRYTETIQALRREMGDWVSACKAGKKESQPCVQN